MPSSFMMGTFIESVDAIVEPDGIRKKKQLRALFAQQASRGRMSHARQRSSTSGSVAPCTGRATHSSAQPGATGASGVCS